MTLCGHGWASPGWAWLTPSVQPLDATEFSLVPLRKPHLGDLVGADWTNRDRSAAGLRR
jgi:hypothetical protein